MLCAWTCCRRSRRTSVPSDAGLSRCTTLLRRQSAWAGHRPSRPTTTVRFNVAGSFWASLVVRVCRWLCRLRFLARLSSELGGFLQCRYGASGWSSPTMRAHDWKTTTWGRLAMLKRAVRRPAVPIWTGREALAMVSGRTALATAPRRLWVVRATTPGGWSVATLTARRGPRPRPGTRRGSRLSVGGATAPTNYAPPSAVHARRWRLPSPPREGPCRLPVVVAATATTAAAVTASAGVAAATSDALPAQRSTMTPRLPLPTAVATAAAVAAAAAAAAAAGASPG